MSNTNTPTPAAAPTHPQQATTASYPPALRRESTNSNLNELPDFPQQWKLPSTSPFQLLFVVACLVSIGQRDLRKFWQQLVEDNGWEKYFTASRDAVMQITTVQGLVLAADAAFITTTPPVPSVNYTSGFNYTSLSTSFLFCIIGLVSQVMFFGVNRSLSQQISLRNPMSVTALLCYFGLSTVPLLAFATSLYFLAFAFLSALVRPGYALAMTCVLSYSLFPMTGHPNAYVILTYIFAVVLCAFGLVVLVELII